MDVYFVDQSSFNRGVAPYVRAVRRDVQARAPVEGALAALFDGTTPAEADAGLILVTSGASGVGEVTVAGGIARIHLQGGCNGGGSTLTVASEIVPTVRQFRDVDHVKIYDPQGTTERPDGPEDSIPLCLEP